LGLAAVRPTKIVKVWVDINERLETGKIMKIIL